MQGGLSIERMCYLAQVSRAGFYRFLEEKTPAEEEVEVRAAIQKIAIEHGAAMDIAGSPLNCAARECRSIANGLRGSCGRTTC